MRTVTGPQPTEIDEHEHLTRRLWERRESERTIVKHHDGRGWQPVTWRELADRVERVAGGLIARGLQPGERVAIISPTRWEWTVTDLAILAAGGVTVPLYDTSSVEQCQWVLSNASVRMAFAADDDLAKRLQDAREAPDLEDVFVFDAGALDQLAGEGADSVDEVARRGEALTTADLATIVYTSGTTGRPKGCRLTHGNIVWTARQSEEALEQLFGPEESTLLFLPLAHIFTRLIQFGCLDQDVVIGYARSLDDMPDDIQTFQPTFLLSVPRVFDKIYNGARKKATGVKRKVFDFAADAAQEYSAADDPGTGTKVKHAVSDKLVYRQLREALGGKVRYCVSGGAPLSPHLGHFFTAAGVTILEGYGLTETSAPATVDTPEGVRIGTVGRPLPGVEVRLADDDEIEVRGRNVFEGYHRNEEATAEVLSDDGWFSTGDRGALDEDGYLRITGRKKELIVTASGKNVAPEVLEERMKAHRLISQPVVVGDDRPFVGALVALDEEELAAFAAEHDLDGRSVAELKDHQAVRAAVQQAVDDANEAVSRAEAIREFVILDRELSMDRDELTPTMKPRRRDITEHFAEDLERLYASA